MEHKANISEVDSLRLGMSGPVTNIITSNNENTAAKVVPQDIIRKKRHPCFDWTQLIATVCIPVVIAVYTIIDNNRNTSIADLNRRKDIEIAEQSRQKDRDLATDQQQENILAEYQTFLAKLILDNGMALNKTPEAKVVGHFKTLTALNQLDARRKSILIRSLYDAQLIILQPNSKQGNTSILELRGVDLSGITLGSSHTSPIKLSFVYYSELNHLYLPFINLMNASFRHAWLDCATFTMAIMDSVDMSFAMHRQTFCLGTPRSFQREYAGTSLVKANLYDAGFYYNDFSSANLTLANMRKFYCLACKFSKAVLLQADLSFSIFFHDFYLGILQLDFTFVKLKQAVAHSAWFHTMNFTNSDWSYVQALKVIINNCTFADATMDNSSFVKSTIRQSIFQNASLYAIDLTDAVLHNVTFINSDMRNANLSSFKCDYCVFINVTFEGAVLENASFRHSIFRNCRVNASQLEEAIDLFGSTLPSGTVEVTHRTTTTTQKLYKTIYNIRIKTGDISGAGTNADVHLKIFGEKVDTNKIQLMSVNHTSDMFESGQIDKFTYELDDLGKIKSILIGHNNKNWGSGWFLDWVEIEIPIRGELYRFACERWLAKDEDDGKIERELTSFEVIKTTSVIPYEITVFTGDKLDAGTDANVFLTVYGEHEDSGEHALLNSKTNRNNFEQNQEDVFEIKAVSLGKLSKIKIRHDDSALGSAWYLDRIVIHDPATNQIYHFICQKWLASDKDDGMISREIPSLESKGVRSTVAHKDISESLVDYGLKVKRHMNRDLEN